MSRRRHSYSSLVARYFVIGLVGSAVAFLILSSVWAGGLHDRWVLAASIVTLFLYVYDKAQSKVGGSRVPELVLHEMALAGGFLGGWLGMLALPHKVRKPIFWVVLAGATLLHVLINRLLWP